MNRNRLLQPLSLAVLAGALLGMSACSLDEAPSQASPKAAPSVPPQDAVAFAPYTAPQALQAGGNCSLDAIDGQPADAAQPKSGANVIFAGWAVDAQGQSPASASLVLHSAEASYALPITTGGDRPDVAQALNKPAAGKSGFNVFAVLTGVEPGSYALSIVYDGQPAAACDLNHSVTVAQ